MKQFIPLIVAGLVALGTFGVYVFVARDIGSSVERIASAVASAEALSARDLALQSAQVLMTEVEPLAESLSTAVLSEQNVVRAIEIIERLGAEENLDVSVSTVETNAVPSWEHHERVVVVVSVEGVYARIAAFLARLEAYPIALRIESGAFEQSGARSWFGTVTITFVKQKP